MKNKPDNNMLFCVIIALTIRDFQWIFHENAIKVICNPAHSSQTLKKNL